MADVKPSTAAGSNEMVERVARAMKARAAEPVGNLRSLEPVLVGSLGDAWPYLARAAIEAMREPTEAMVWDGADEARLMDRRYDTGKHAAVDTYQAMIDAALIEPNK